MLIHRAISVPNQLVQATRKEFPGDGEACVRMKPYNLLTIFLGCILLLPGAARGQEKIVLVETGSSMPEPLYKNWIEEFHKQQPSAEIRYMATGTAESTRNVLAGSGDFGGGDAPIP